jgi:hypothetical protein
LALDPPERLSRHPTGNLADETPPACCCLVAFSSLLKAGALFLFLPACLPASLVALLQQETRHVLMLSLEAYFLRQERSPALVLPEASAAKRPRAKTAFPPVIHVYIKKKNLCIIS